MLKAFAFYPSLHPTLCPSKALMVNISMGLRECGFPPRNPGWAVCSVIWLEGMGLEESKKLSSGMLLEMNHYCRRFASKTPSLPWQRERFLQNHPKRNSLEKKHP